MINPFKLKGTFGADYSVDGEDILRTKTALNKLGYFEEKEFVNFYADQRMIDGLKNFQQSRGLQADGVMKPDGPTARELRKALAEQRPQPSQRSLVAKERHKPTPRPLPTYMPTRAPHRPQPRPWHEPPLTEVDLFRLLGDVGRRRRNDPRDVVATRRALGWAGELAPGKGAEELRANDNLFAAIDRFQARTGVKRDGWMGKGGETEKALNAEIGPKVAARTSKSSDKGSDPKANAGNTEVAMWGQILSRAAPYVIRALPGVGASIEGQKAAKETLKNKPNERRDITPPPSIPPSQPPEPNVPDRTETPAKAPVVEMNLSHPIPEKTEPGILIHPMLPEELQNLGTIIERKGNEATRKELEGIRDHYEELGWEHIGGGRYSGKNRLIGTTDPKTDKVISAGDEFAETHIPGPGKAWERDSRPGGHFTDLTFKTPSGKIVHIQSVDVDRNGKPTRRELDAAERIRRAHQKGVYVFLIPKGAQLKRNKNVRK